MRSVKLDFIMILSETDFGLGEIEVRNKRIDESYSDL